ncbi:amidohydrolase family protein [Candidatus Palauibacter sp.]|uniref:amidohydrolase family protein n=1 Tax=Candidatus Palauibacter sp. TaxID=3101350 RepID=UPI003B028DCC
MKRRKRFTASGTTALAVGLAACGGPGSVVIDNANIIDGTGAVWPDGRLVVVDGLVTCVGAEADCAGPSGVDVLDADGFWVVPGLIDVEDAREEPSAEQAAYMAFLLGVTTAGVREAPPGPEGEPRPPAGSDDPRIPAPRPATPVEAPERPFGIFGDALAATIPLDSGPAARGERDLRVFARSRWVLADREALLDSARAMGARGLMFAPRLLEQERWAAPYRLPHGMNRLLEHPMITERIQDRLLPGREPGEAEQLGAALEVLRAFVREFHAAGGSVSTATAGALAPGLALHEEMDALTAAGLSPEDALYAATREAARALGLERSRGTLEAGKLGDFLILESDPRVDISLTQTVSRVGKGGVLYDPPTLFDALLDSAGSRVSDNPLRMLVGGGALLLTLLLFWRGVRRHRRSLGPRLML